MNKTPNESRPTRNQYSSEIKNKAKELSETGKTTGEISKIIGVPAGLIYNWTKRKYKPATSGRDLVSFKKRETDSKRCIGFREITLVRNESISQNSNGMVQICAPNGLSMWVPVSEEKVLAMFFRGGF